MARAESRAFSTDTLQELSPRTFCTFSARVVVTPPRALPIVLEELSGVRKRPMIRSMPITARPQQRYDLSLTKTPSCPAEGSTSCYQGLPTRSLRARNARVGIPSDKVVHSGR
jgi:hypothetical protein